VIGMELPTTYGRYTVPKAGFIPWTAAELWEMRIADKQIDFEMSPIKTRRMTPEQIARQRERKASYYQRNREQIRAYQAEYGKFRRRMQRREQNALETTG
jgi:hypothetical protein